MDANAEETFKFDSSSSWWCDPKEYIPAVGEGIEEASKSGILGGFPVLGVHATVFDGSYHEVDSQRDGIQDCWFHGIQRRLCRRHGSVLLEPIMKVEVNHA